MTTQEIEQRLATQEREVAALKRSRPESEGENSPWPDALFGRLKDFPEWAAIAREGKKIGNAQDDYSVDDVCNG